MKPQFFTYTFLSLLTLFTTVACDVKQPQVEAEWASVAFRHTGSETSCSSCHADHAPAPVNSFSHYNNNDCVLCHYAGQKWTDHAFHSQNADPTSCNSCHEKDRKPPAMSVTHGNGDDCVGCHTVTTNWAAGAGSPHDPTPTSCNSCHAVDRPAAVNGLEHYNAEDCVTCHVAGGVWANYKNYGHTPITATCNQCHQNERPALSNHPSQNNAKVTDKTHYSAKDCAACHKPPSTTRAFTFAHTTSTGAKIGFCLPCHYTKGWAKHSSKPQYFVGDGTCFTCHNKGKKF